MRPIVVSILAILIILVGLLFLFLGVIGLIATYYVAFSQFQSLAPVTLTVSLILLVIGGIFMISGVGLWRLRLWAWALALIVVIFALLSEAIRFTAFSFIIELVLLIYLLAVRKHFT